MKSLARLKKYIWSIIFYLWLASIVVLTALPFSGNGQKNSDSEFRWDYLQHFMIYAAIVILFYLADGAFLKTGTHRNGIILFIAGLVLCAVTEIYQLWIPGRAFTPIDLILNFSGFGVGIIVGTVINSKK